MNYFDDLKMTKLLMKEIEERKQGKRKGPSDELGKAFLQVLEHTLTSRKYRNYTDDWKDEFRGLAIEKFLKHWYKFNPERIQKNYYQREGKKYLKDKSEWKGAHTFFTQMVISSIHDIINKFKKYHGRIEDIAESYDRMLEQEINNHLHS